MYARILVPIDGSEPADCGLREAIGIARSTQATLVLLNVARESPTMMDGVAMAYYNDLLASMLRAGEAMIAKAAKTVAEAGLACESVVVDAGAGSAWQAIVAQVVRKRCDGVVEGRRVFANLLQYIRVGASSNFGNTFSVLGASAWLPFLPMAPIRAAVAPRIERAGAFEA